MTISLTLPSSDTIECDEYETILELKKGIEKKSGTPWRHQQLFSIGSETPLGNRDRVSETHYYLMVNPVEAIRDGDVLRQCVNEWFEGDQVVIRERYGEIEDWEVSQVEDMRGVFSYRNMETIDLSGWDVGSVTDMSMMFMDCCRLKGVSGWDVSKVKDMSNMFFGCSKCCIDLSGWDVSCVKDMYGMFSGCLGFTSDLSGWDVGSVTDMCNMFSGCVQFNSDVSQWDVSKVTNMYRMFSGCHVFNSDVSEWDVSSVENTASIFWDCPQFTGDVGYWESRDHWCYHMFEDSEDPDDSRY